MPRIVAHLRPARSLLAAILALNAHGQGAGARPGPRPAASPGPGPGHTILAQAALGRDRLELVAGSHGRRRILRRSPGGEARELACGALEGAWGLWVTDVDGDNRPDLVITLHKRARYDPVPANRLHVLALVGDRCVPLWRGTRLAGRFSQVRPEGFRLFAQEAVGRGLGRLVRYRWSGFGYVVDTVIWQGKGNPPASLVRRHLGEPSPRQGAP